MNLSNKEFVNDEIDLREIILKLWREKFLIIIISIIFTLAGYIYGAL